MNKGPKILQQQQGLNQDLLLKMSTFLEPVPDLVNLFRIKAISSKFNMEPLWRIQNKRWLLLESTTPKEVFKSNYELPPAIRYETQIQEFFQKGRQAIKELFLNHLEQLNKLEGLLSQLEMVLNFSENTDELNHIKELLKEMRLIVKGLDQKDIDKCLKNNNQLMSIINDFSSLYWKAIHMERLLNALNRNDLAELKTLEKERDRFTVFLNITGKGLLAQKDAESVYFDIKVLSPDLQKLCVLLFKNVEFDEFIALIARINSDDDDEYVRRISDKVYRSKHLYKKFLDEIVFDDRGKRIRREFAYKMVNEFQNQNSVFYKLSSFNRSDLNSLEHALDDLCRNDFDWNKISEMQRNLLNRLVFSDAEVITFIHNCRNSNAKFTAKDAFIIKYLAQNLFKHFEADLKRQLKILKGRPFCPGEFSNFEDQDSEPSRETLRKNARPENSDNDEDQEPKRKKALRS